MSQSIILASSSPFRKQLLQKVVKNFETFSPDIDESVKANEPPEQLVRRLAIEKAKASANVFQHGWAIGSDQVALFNANILGKPHTVDNAIAQLRQFSGQTVQFLTGLALYDIEFDRYQYHLERFNVIFKALSDEQIKAYIAKEMPLNCAGSFKSEGLGITLFESLDGRDPNALIGLPLIALNELLSNWEFDLLLQ